MAVRHIAFVPASGVSKKIRFFGVKLPKFFSWRIFHFFLGLPGVKVKYTGELNMETLSRLEETVRLYNEGIFKKVFVAGGYERGIKYTTSYMMKCYLANVLHRMGIRGEIISGAIEKNDVFVGDRSSDSMGHARELADFVADLPEETICLYIITSKYHMTRAEDAILNGFYVRKIDKELMIENYPIKPPNNAETIFNRCIEPILRIRDSYRMSRK